MSYVEIKAEIELHKHEFERIYKCLNKKKLPKDDTVKNHIDNIIKEYNNIKTILLLHFDKLEKQQQLSLVAITTPLRDKLIKIFKHLSLHIKIPVALENLVDKNIETDSDSEEEEENMPQAKTDILRIAAQTINKTFSGDPLGLKAFLNSVTLLESITEADNIDFLKQFIISKLDSKALEAIPENPATILEIKEALKSKIKPDNSKIIEARMLALRSDNLSSQEFSKTAEELADALTRTLIVEGVPQQKANEMSIEKTIEMCRATARNNIVKSILAASQFADPKSVIAKFIVETNIDNKDKQVLFYKKSYGNNGFRNNFRGNSSNFSNFSQRNPQNYNNGNKNNFNRNNPSQNHNFNNSQANNNRGNGKRNFNNYRNSNVRYTNSGNEETPLEMGLGEVEEDSIESMN